MSEFKDLLEGKQGRGSGTVCLAPSDQKKEAWDICISSLCRGVSECMKLPIPTVSYCGHEVSDRRAARKALSRMAFALTLQKLSVLGLE